MKKTLLFISSILIGAASFAQSVVVPNAGFESWVASGLDKWSDTLITKSSSNFGNNNAEYNVVDSVIANPYAGSKSIVLHSNTNSALVGFGGPVVMVPGILVSGEKATATIQSSSTINPGPPFSITPVGTPTITITGSIPFGGTKSPNGLKGNYKFKSDSAITGTINLLLFANGGDTVAAYADINSLLNASNSVDTLDALVYKLSKTNTWTSFSFNLTANILGGYSTIPATIDSARIVAITCSPKQLIAGKSSAVDSLFLDGLEFTYPAPPTGIESLASAAFNVSQNAPNPFDGTTTITFNAAASADVTFTVVDLLGRVVKEQTFSASAGTNTITFTAGSSAPGTYFYTVSDGRNTVTKKMVISK